MLQFSSFQSSSFVAIDFETANHARNSACAVALVRVEEDRIAQRACHLIRPPGKEFLFSHIHGITWSQVAHEATFGEIWPSLSRMLHGIQFLAAHNAPFDRAVLEACCRTYGFSTPPIPFLCTVQLARKRWNIRPTKLPDVCRHLGISLNHHDAASDAQACAQIVMEAGKAEC